MILVYLFPTDVSRSDYLSSHINNVNEIRHLHNIQEYDTRHKQNCIFSPNTEKSNLVYQLITSTKEAIRCVPISILIERASPLRRSGSEGHIILRGLLNQAFDVLINWLPTLFALPL